MTSQLSSVFTRYSCPAPMMRQTTLKLSVRTLKTCTAGSQEPSSASEDQRDTSLITLMTTETGGHRKQITPQLEGCDDYGGV